MSEIHETYTGIRHLSLLVSNSNKDALIVIMSWFQLGLSLIFLILAGMVLCFEDEKNVDNTRMF